MYAFEAVWCLVLLVSLTTLTEGIKCFCSDKTYCNNGVGPEEDCKDQLSLNYYKNNSLKLQRELMPAVFGLLVLREQIDRKITLTKEETEAYSPVAMKKASEVLNGFLPDKQITFNLLLQDLGDDLTLLQNEGKTPGEDFKKKIDSALSLKATPRPRNFQFCVKLIDKKGILRQACGIIASQLLGFEVKSGCNIYTVPNEVYTNYCRCNEDLCNVGNITVAGTAAGTAAGTVAGTDAGTAAGTVAGTVAGTDEENSSSGIIIPASVLLCFTLLVVILQSSQF